MKKFIMVIPIAIMLIETLLFTTKSMAVTESIKINMSDEKITVDGDLISSSGTVYKTSKMDNGGTSDDATDANEKIENIINISEAGTYEFSGSLSDGQISINANEINGTVNIILNNVDITCKNAPAIFVYCKDITNENCKVIITSAEGSTNTITGAKLKTSVEGWEDQDSILYYVEKDYDDDGSYYERYKYDAAISSDISLTFDGTGTLNVISSKKEGIESKMNITFEDGNYYISSLDDAINACADRQSVITINGGTIVANVLNDADEGDGIDSNGSIVINGGKVYAFAHPGSDNGLDSDLGITINGGTVLSTGSMHEEIKATDDSKLVDMQLSEKVSAGDSIVIVDEDDQVIFAFKTDREVSIFAYYSDDLEETDSEYKVYTGTEIDGTLDENNIYTNITSIDLDEMTLQENRQMDGQRGMNGFRNNQNTETSKITPSISIIAAVVIFTIISIILIAKIFM